MKKFIALAAAYFVSYPQEHTLYFTSDEQAFFSPNDALNHAQSLRNKPSEDPLVVTVTREDAYGEIPGEGQTGETNTGINALTKEDAKASFDKAAAIATDAKAAWDEKAAKLAEAPDNKNYQKWEAAAKAKFEEANAAWVAAGEALAKFTDAEKN